MPTAFVTGITGQDGGYLAERLVAEGWAVHGLLHHADSQRDEFEASCPTVVLHAGDLRDSAGLAALIEQVAPDEIYNLGGVSSVALSWEQPLLTAESTGMGAAAILEAAWQQQRRSGGQVRVLQASSSEMFGSSDSARQTENTPLRPTSPYGAAKAFAHNLVTAYRHLGLHASTCILYNHESPRRPPSFVTRKITQAVAMIAAGRQDTLALGNLEVRRDWGWAPDYVDAMIRTIRHDDPADYVVATGKAHSVRDFVALAFTRAGIPEWRKHISVDPAFVRAADAAEQAGDAGKARDVLGWQPSIQFEEIVRRMVDHDMALLGSSR